MFVKVFINEKERSNRMTVKEFSEKEFEISIIEDDKITSIKLLSNDLEQLIKELEDIKKTIKHF